MKARIEFRDKTEITVNKIENPQRICCMINGDDMAALRQNALDNNTTVAEIIRALVRNYLNPKPKRKA